MPQSTWSRCSGEHIAKLAYGGPLANASDLLTPVVLTIARGSIFNGSKLRSYFSPFVDQSSPDYISRRRRYRSLQRHFRLSISCSVPEIFAIEVRSHPKSRRKSHFDRREYLRNGTRYRQSEKVLQTAFILASADVRQWTLVSKRRYSRSKCEVVRNRAQKSIFFGPNFLGEDPKFWT